MYCSKCGENVGNANVCPKCGHCVGGYAVPPTYAQQQEDKDSTGCGTLLSSALGFLFPIFGAILALGFYLAGHKKCAKTIILSSGVGFGFFIILGFIGALGA